MDGIRKLRVPRWCAGWIAGMMAILFAFTATAQPAGAGKPKVYVFSFVKAEDVSTVVFNKVEQYFYTLFEMSSKLQLVTDKQLKVEQRKKAKEERRKKTTVSEPWLEEADALLWKGKDFIVKKSYGDAIASLTQSRGLYEEHYLELRDYDKLVDATLQLSIAFFLAGYKDDGEELLKDVLVWRPTLVVDKKKYPKDFVAAIEKLRKQMERRRGGVLRIEATPSEGASVFVDGLLKGKLSKDRNGIDVEGLYRGRHYIQVIRDGYKIFAKIVGVPNKGRTAKVVAQLEQMQQEERAAGSELEQLSFAVFEYAQTGDFGVELSRKAKAFADQAQVPYLLFGYFSKEPKGTRLTLFLFKAEWSALAEIDSVTFDHNLTNLQVNLLFLEANLAQALKTFPKKKTVRGTPAVYVKKVEEPKKVVVPEKKAPEKVKKKAPETPVKVVKPEKKEPEKTVRVTPREVEKEDPVIPSRTRDEDLGELSSIFAGGGESGSDTDNPYVVPTQIPGGEDDDDDDGKLTSKWWFWTGIAAGAALVGGGSWLLYDQLGSSGGGSKYNATVRW